MVFVVNDEDDVDGMQDAGVAMLRAFNYITDDEDDQHAFDAIISVSPHTHTHTPTSHTTEEANQITCTHT